MFRSSGGCNQKSIEQGKNHLKILNMLEIEHPISGVKIQVAKNAFPEDMTWHEAQRASVGLGDGWRRLTIEEWQREDISPQ
jgi:hypothetical protein